MWYKTIETHFQLLTNTVETHKSPQGGREGEDFHPAAGGRTAKLLAATSASLSPEIIKLKQSISSNTKWLNHAAKTWNIQTTLQLPRAKNGSCCFLLVYAKVYDEVQNLH